jgi:hypothetical protein
VETPMDLAETVRILMEELQSFKENNERLIKEQEKQTEINVVLLQILSYIQEAAATWANIPVMWIDISPRKPRFHLRYKNMALKITT